MKESDNLCENVFTSGILCNASFRGCDVSLTDRTDEWQPVMVVVLNHNTLKNLFSCFSFLSYFQICDIS